MLYTNNYIPDLCVCSLKSVSKDKSDPWLIKQQRLRKTELFLVIWNCGCGHFSAPEQPKIFSNNFSWFCLTLNEIIRPGPWLCCLIGSNLFGHYVWIQILSLVHEGRELETEAQWQAGKKLSIWKDSCDPQSLEAHPVLALASLLEQDNLNVIMDAL